MPGLERISDGGGLIVQAAQVVNAQIQIGGPDATARARLEARVPKIGLFEKDLRVLANAAGLAVSAAVAKTPQPFR